jgi:hypothetical protein
MQCLAQGTLVCLRQQRGCATPVLVEVEEYCSASGLQSKTTWKQLVLVYILCMSDIGLYMAYQTEEEPKKRPGITLFTTAYWQPLK